jgi:hypothetical protein
MNKTSIGRQRGFLLYYSLGIVDELSTNHKRVPYFTGIKACLKLMGFCVFKIM